MQTQKQFNIEVADHLTKSLLLDHIGKYAFSHNITKKVLRETGERRDNPLGKLLPNGIAKYTVAELRSLLINNKEASSFLITALVSAYEKEIGARLSF